MALTFRYRYVDFGTVFIGDPRLRDATAAAKSPGTLFANELATDVGGTCWGSNEPLAVIDHHFSCEGQFTSASAAVLHKAQLIRNRFAQPEGDLVWLVTHRPPDFDAFCSMYLARWIIESPDAAVNWQAYGLHPDGWLDLPDRSEKKLDWFNPDLSRVAPEHRWPLLLASFASALDSRHRVSCPRRRALNSVLCAALKRGRDYMSEASGATEFFDEVRASLLPNNLNPIFDSVLEGSAAFAPELAMLDLEAEAYERDLCRARKSVVYLPQSEAPSPKFFKSPKQVALLQEQDRSAEVDAEHLLLADTFRIPTSGIYLRDPECLLFQEWARLDLENSPLGVGFEFTAIAASNGRPAGAINKSDYIFSIDPERANGRHLYTVWSRLQTKEVEALRAQEQRSDAPVAFHVAPGVEQRAAMGALLADPWFGGPNSSGTVVRTPNRGTMIGPPGTRGDLRDDAIVEAVRTELENPIYSAESLVAGPQVTVIDFSASKNYQNDPLRKFDLNAPLQIPPPQQSYFRFASIRLRADVPILSGDDSVRGSLAEQIGEALWQVLYPDQPGSKPSDFTERHLIATSDGVGVWGNRGIAVAQKYFSGPGAASPAEGQTLTLHDDFAGIVSLARDIDQFTAEAFFSVTTAPSPDVALKSPGSDGTRDLEATVARGVDLAVRAAELQHTLALPDRDLLRRFWDVIGVDRLLATLRDLNHTATESLRRQQVAEQAKLMGERDAVIAKIRSRLEWLEVFIVGFLAIEIIEAIARHGSPGNMLEDALLLLGGPFSLALIAWILKPWKRKSDPAVDSTEASPWILIAVIAACLVAWLAGLLHIFTK
ncbi:MAG: hypothetical protein ACLPPV_09070 [Candidatus Korobacteraceae bacterium]|jgi:hypothetical protein